VTRTITLSVDQLYRAQPGGIGTYVRGLASGLASLGDDSFDVVGLAPSGPVPAAAAALEIELVKAPVPLRLLTKLWSTWALGVPRRSSVVHATSMAGPFGGGGATAVHSVAMHDLLWRDEPDAATSAGVRFHESRLALLARREDVRIFTSSPPLADRLVAEGFSPSRLHRVRLGVDDDATAPASTGSVAQFLAAQGVTGPFTLYAGTREPRKNLDVLIAAHQSARHDRAELGPLVVAGPPGWGGVETHDATVVGHVERSMLKGLYRDAAVVAYVPRAEGWGLPPVEALHAGASVVASTTTPSVAANPEVVLVDPLDVTSVANGLLVALDQPSDAEAAARRRDSVSELTWRNCALDHMAGWR
jgi:glycosyltransferase involved in cell wall biosynthesis